MNISLRIAKKMCESIETDMKTKTPFTNDESQKKHSRVWNALVRQHAWQPRALEPRRHLKSEKNIVFFSQLIVVVSVVVCVCVSIQSTIAYERECCCLLFHMEFWTRCQATPEKYRSQAVKLNRAWAWPNEWHGRDEFNHSKYKRKKNTYTSTPHTKQQQQEIPHAANPNPIARQTDWSKTIFQWDATHNNRLIFVYIFSIVDQAMGIKWLSIIKS